MLHFAEWFKILDLYFFSNPMYGQTYTKYLMLVERMTHMVLIFIVLSLFTITKSTLTAEVLRLLLPPFEIVFDWGREGCKSKNKGPTMPGIQIGGKKKENYWRIQENIVIPQTLLKTLAFKACF